MDLENKNHKIFFIPKDELKKPINTRSKLVEELAENDPNNPGNSLKN